MAKDQFTLYEIVLDGEGKKHKVYSMQLKYKNEVVDFMSKFNDNFIFIQFMEPKMSDTEIGLQDRDNEGKLIYDESIFNDLLDIIEIALRFKETKEQILEWIDLRLVKEIIGIFLDMSQLLKKKTMEN